jgi:hypothetical protein
MKKLKTPLIAMEIMHSKDRNSHLYSKHVIPLTLAPKDFGCGVSQLFSFQMSLRK